jgi:hypothetical protein
MSPEELIRTSLLLGAFVLMAGCYGFLYSVGSLRGDKILLHAGWASYGLQCIVAAAIVFSTPLTVWWKLLIVSSAAIYFRIPPVTWRYLQTIHEAGENSS